MFTDLFSVEFLNASNKKVNSQCSPLIYNKIEEFPLLSKDNDEEKKLIIEMKIQLFKDVEKIIFLLANFDQKTFKSFQNTSQNDIDIDQVSLSHKFLSIQNIIQSHLLIQNVYGIYENTSISYNSLIDKQITMIAQNFYNLSTILSATDNAPTTGDFGRYLLLQKQGAAFNYKALLIINSFLYKNPQVNNFKNKYKNLFVTLYKTQYVFDKMQNQNKLFSQEFLKIIKKKRTTTMSLLDKYIIDKILENIEEDVKKKCIFISLKKKKISQKIPTNIDKIFNQLNNVILEEDVVQVLDNYKFICEVQEVTDIYQNIIDTQKVKQNNKDLVDNVEIISKQINLDNIKTKLEEIFNYLNNKGICNFEKIIVNHSIYSCINNNICDKDNLYWQCNMVMSVLNIYRLFFQEVSSLCEKGYPCLSIMLKQYRVELDPLQNVAGIISMYSKCSTFYQSMVEIYNMTYGDLNKIEHFQSFLKQNKISTVLDLNNFLLKHVTATYCQKELVMLKGIMKENMSSAYQYTHVMELDLLKNFLLIYTEIFNLNNEKNIANDEDLLITQLKLGEINVIKEPETKTLASTLYEKKLYETEVKQEEIAIENQEKKTIDNPVANQETQEEHRKNSLLSVQKKEESILNNTQITDGLLNTQDLTAIDQEDRLLISKLQKENTELKQSLQMLEEDYDIIVNKESDLKQSLMEQIEKNETYKEEVHQLKCELNHMNQTKGKKNRHKLQPENTAIEAYNELLIKYNELLDKHNKVLGTFQQVQTLQKKYDELQKNSELENRRIMEMKEENRQISLLREENLELKRVIDVFAKDGEHDKLIAELKKLQTDNELLTKEKKELTVRYDKIRKNIDNLNTEKQTIANEKQKLQKTIDQSRDVQYIKKIEDHVEELEEKFKETAKENDELLNEFKKLQESLYHSENMKDVLSAQNQDLQNNNNRLVIENNKLKKNNELLQKQNEFLQQKNK